MKGCRGLEKGKSSLNVESKCYNHPILPLDGRDLSAPQREFGKSV